MEEKLPPHLVRNAGVFYVCHRLSRMGWNALPRVRKAKGPNVVIDNEDEERTWRLKVRSQALGDLGERRRHVGESRSFVTLQGIFNLREHPRQLRWRKPLACLCYGLWLPQVCRFLATHAFSHTLGVSQELMPSIRQRRLVLEEQIGVYPSAFRRV